MCLIRGKLFCKKNISYKVICSFCSKLNGWASYNVTISIQIMKLYIVILQPI